MDIEKAKEVLKRYNEGICTEEEKVWVESWYLQQLDLSEDLDIKTATLNTNKKRIWQNIARERKVLAVKPRLYPKIAIAASIVMAIGATLYFNKSIYSIFRTPNEQISGNKVLPGGDKAYLTLANGRKVNLNKLNEGQQIEEEGVKVVKAADGQLVYVVKNRGIAGSGYNTIETPAGGQFEVQLPDGTKVWLNASSSLRYPVNFSAKERKVELKGEGYFEVKSDIKRPFKVASKEQVVEVLGTHFNINTYADEPDTKTTLIEGSVKVNRQNVSKILKPGEQATISPSGFEVEKVDVSQAIAWHNGDFAFEGTDLKTIMRQLSRWYDVEVVYEGDIEHVKFGGSISRSKNIAEILKVLKMTQRVNFKLEGRRVLVMP